MMEHFRQTFREEADELLAELEFQDANGERLSVSRRIPLWPAAVTLGLRPDGWAASPEQLRFQAVAVDLSGKSRVVVRAPMAARNFRPGQFYRMQNYEGTACVPGGGPGYYGNKKYPMPAVGPLSPPELRARRAKRPSRGRQAIRTA